MSIGEIPLVACSIFNDPVTAQKLIKKNNTMEKEIEILKEQLRQRAIDLKNIDITEKDSNGSMIGRAKYITCLTITRELINQIKSLSKL